MSTIPIILLWVCVAVISFWLLAFILRLLWNSTMPELFQITRITTWQAAKLFLIVAILLSPFSVRVAESGTQPKMLCKDDIPRILPAIPRKDEQNPQ